MKKYLAIMMCAGLLLTATGCGEELKENDSKTKATKVEEKAKNKVLSCSQSFDELNEKYYSTFTYDLEGKNLQDITYKITMDFDEDELEEAKDYAHGYCEDAKEDSAVKSCEAKISGNQIVADLKFDVDELDEEEYDKDVEELKEIMEEEDATCKIEEK